MVGKTNKKKSKAKSKDGSSESPPPLSSDGQVLAGSVKPKLCTLTDQERQKVEGMREILAEVWSPFQTMEEAVSQLETDTAPAMELEFWDTLAAAYLRYYGQAIILKVNMAGLKKTQNKEENEKKTAPSLSPAVDEETGPASSPGQGSGLGTAENQGVRENVEAVEKFEMVPMKDVPYLGRSERLGIIQATVPTEKRRMVLQRLFCISQAPPEEFEAMIELAKVKGNEAGADVIRDVNLLESWQVVREERDHLWTAAKEKVRSIVEQQRQTETSAEEATPQETAQEETPTPTSGQGGKEGKGGAGSGGV